MHKDHARRVDAVGRRLEEEILSGQLRPGDRLTVIPLAQRFGMSQSTIREALLTLEQRGLVKSRPRRGAFVTRLSEQEAIELCRMRALLEAYAVTLGAPQATDATLDALAAHVHEMAACRLPRSLPRLIQIDLAFHREIAALAGSEMLLELWSRLSSRIGALMMRSVEANQLTTADAVRYHTDVVDALATRDPRTCRLAVIEHYLPDSMHTPLHIGPIDAAALAMNLTSSV